MVGAADLELLERAIAEAESKTAGEIRVCIARRSSPLPWLPCVLFGAAAGAAGHFAAAEWLEQIGGPLSSALAWMGPSILAVLATLALWPRPLEAVESRARRAFERMMVSGTTARTGVLLYLSLAERRAVLIADEAVDSKVPPEAWVGILEPMLRETPSAAAIAAAVGSIGAILAERFPSGPDDVNELPDHVETE